MWRVQSARSILACLVLLPSLTWAQSAPTEAIINAVSSSGVFPPGTKVLSVKGDTAVIQVDLTQEAAPARLGDTQADAMSHAVADALAPWPEITGVELTVAGRPLWQYLPKSVNGGVPPRVRWALPKAAALSATSELAGKLVALHPSHGAYWDETNNHWVREMRPLCGPNPATSIPPGWAGSTVEPSDYYYWTVGYQWGSFREDDISPETIRFLAKYCESSGAEVWVSRNLDKNAGDFDYNGYGYPNCSFPLPKWVTAAKYYLQDRGDVPSTVWDTSDDGLTAQADKDVRARPYYANYRMAQKFPGQDQSSQSVWGNCVSLSLHSNALGIASNGSGRGTEAYWYTSKYPYLQSEATRFTGNIDGGALNAIRNYYDGFWADAMYVRGASNPPEWPSGTYYGYQQAGGSTTRWHDRGVKTANFGEIREAMMPATLCEVAFHDDWKFYPDHVFLMDQIWRATVAWGFYEGICNQFYVTPKPRLAATLVSVSFPADVSRNQAFTGSVTLQNQGMAWCWGNKFTAATKQYGPYTVWKLQATAGDQFAPGTKIAIAQDTVAYPGDSVTFAVTLTAPATPGVYTTQWQMLKDEAFGGSFGDIASAQISVNATPAPTITAITPAQGNSASPVSITNLTGTGFIDGATVKLTRPGPPDLAATDVVWVSATQLTCTFNLSGAVPGAWDVVVTNPDGLVGSLAGGFTVLPRLFENFDAYANQAAFQAVWFPLFNDGSSMTLLQSFPCISDSQGLHGYTSTEYHMRNYRYLDSWTLYTGSDDQPMVFGCWMRDPDATKSSAATFVETRAHSGQGFPTPPPYPAGTAPPFNTTLQSLLAMGTWSTPAPAANWHVRVIGTGTSAWYALNTPRVSNRWTRLTAKAYSSRVEFYVDDALDMIVPLTAPLDPMDAVLLGSGHVSTDDVAVDDVLLTVGPSPGVEAITPYPGGSTGFVHNASLTGSGFVGGATVKLVKLGQPAITAGSVAVISPAKMTCTLDLTGAATGWRDVMVINPDGRFARLADAFFVCSSALGDLDHDCDIDGDDLARFRDCAGGPTMPIPDGCAAFDLDGDEDIDQDDFGVFQRCISGPGVPANPACAN